MTNYCPVMPINIGALYNTMPRAVEATVFSPPVYHPPWNEAPMILLLSLSIPPQYHAAPEKTGRCGRGVRVDAVTLFEDRVSGEFAGSHYTKKATNLT